MDNLRIYKHENKCPACRDYASYYRTLCKNNFPCKSHFKLTEMHFERKCSTCDMEWIEISQGADWSQANKDLENFKTANSTNLTTKDIKVGGFLAKIAGALGLDRDYKKAMQQAIVMEREACAKIADLVAKNILEGKDDSRQAVEIPKNIASMIRARKDSV